MSNELTAQEKKLTKAEEDIVLGKSMRNRGILHMARGLKAVKEDKLWEISDNYPSFSHYCQSTAELKESTALAYIWLYDTFVEKKGLEMSELDGISHNKLLLLQGVKSPDKYLEAAKTQGMSDFRKYINEHEHGIKPKDDEVDRHIAKSGCPHWKGKCTKKDLEF